MSHETYTLQVPLTLGKTAEGEDIPVPEYVSHGNVGAELKPGGTVETGDRRFADFLADRYGLELVSEADEHEPDGETPGPIESGYPEEFPGRDALVAAGVPHATAVTLDRDQLIAYKGIGPKTADEIIAFVAEGGK